jgi:hypothetical protein
MRTQGEINLVSEAIFRAWDCIVAESSAIYLSGPITTGPRYVRQVRNGLSHESAIKQIREINVSDLLSAATLLWGQRHRIVVEPSRLQIPEWSQAEYHRFWEKLIEKYVNLAIFMPGWEYSHGCAIEFAHAYLCGIRTETIDGAPLSIERAVGLLVSAREDLKKDDAGGALARLRDCLDRIVRSISRTGGAPSVSNAHIRKDESLDILAKRGMNVAQFVSFSPAASGNPRQEYCRIRDYSPNEKFADVRSAIDSLLKASKEGSVNIRSYQPQDSKSREFVYGLTTVWSAIDALERFSSQGLHTIINETVDVKDGGVSGVLMHNVLEYSPDDTPRCVEKPGVASLPTGLGCELLSTVYGFPINFPVPFDSRLEFSLHPRPSGWLESNIIAWELSEGEQEAGEARILWPNNFSRLIGDKTFGLLIAHHLGLPVPFTTVINRRIAPFSFGRHTGWAETWIRTAPPEQAPGRFATHRGWMDPFALLQSEDPDGQELASVLSQRGINPVFSGALIVGEGGVTIIEGRAGTGVPLMLGEVNPEPLPNRIISDVRSLYQQAEAALGPVRFEWVHDNNTAWIVQFHRGVTDSSALRLTSGEAAYWVEFDVTNGLAALRNLLTTLDSDEGLILKGRVGLTSHVADVIRKSGVPAKMAF